MLLAVHFVLGPMYYRATLERIDAEQVTHDQLLARYDITTIEFKTETVHTGPGLRYGKPTANDSYERDYSVIDGVRRDCVVIRNDNAPTLDCDGWAPPLR